MLAGTRWAQRNILDLWLSMYYSTAAIRERGGMSKLRHGHAHLLPPIPWLSIARYCSKDGHGDQGWTRKIGRGQFEVFERFSE